MQGWIIFPWHEALKEGRKRTILLHTLPDIYKFLHKFSDTYHAFLKNIIMIPLRGLGAPFAPSLASRGVRSK